MLAWNVEWTRKIHSGQLIVIDLIQLVSREYGLAAASDVCSTSILGERLSAEQFFIMGMGTMLAVRHLADSDLFTIQQQTMAVQDDFFGRASEPHFEDPFRRCRYCTMLR